MRYEYSILFENSPSRDDEGAQLDAINKLSPYVGDSLVLEALCEAALTALNPMARNKIIVALKPQSEQACRRFSQMAGRTTCRKTRHRALMTLRLFNCRTMEAALRNGMRHSRIEVQNEAALSRRLFEDPDFLMAIDRVMAHNRFFFSKESVRTTASKIAEFLNRTRVKKAVKMYRKETGCK